jgi:phosphodiesterase/alkaline phosphatase D-like protein
MNVGAVSCNFTVKRAETDLWKDLKERYISQGQLDLLLHLGDQVYGDNAFYEAQQILNGKSRGDSQQENQILELYRRLYRWTWNDAATREVLANVSNLMIWDDHEIRDDWGSLKSDKDPNSAEYYIGTLARRVFREYQRQLWDEFDPGTGTAADLEYHFHAWGPIGLLLLDLRGGRSFQTDPAKPYLGTRQWTDLRKALQNRRIRALLVGMSVPLVFLSSAISGVGSHWMDDLMDHWSYGPHRKEQVELIRLLRYWKDDAKGERELLVVAGDVHIGGYSDVKRRESTIFKQLIASPITNRPPRWYEFQGIRILLEAQQKLGERYSFEHHDFTNRRNYGVILVRIPPKGKPKVDGTLVEAVASEKVAES